MIGGLGRTTEVLERWNGMDVEAAAREVLPCCGSRAWARGVAELRPFGELDALLLASDAVWRGLGSKDWDEAFRSHPRIGERKAVGAATEASVRWSGQEQDRAMAADDVAKAELAEGNARYEKRFGRIFIICASGRGAAEILEEMDRRMGNDAVSEMRESTEEQGKITELRLRRWLEGTG